MKRIKIVSAKEGKVNVIDVETGKAVLLNVCPCSIKTMKAILDWSGVEFVVVEESNA